MSEPDRFQVRIGPEALSDIDAIAAYLSEHAGAAAARDFIDAVLAQIGSLERFPFRGSEPKELAGGHPGRYRQILLRHHRLFYRVQGQTVTIVMIVDGRRDLAPLLRDRLAPDPPA